MFTMRYSILVRVCIRCGENRQQRHVCAIEKVAGSVGSGCPGAKHQRIGKSISRPRCSAISNFSVVALWGGLVLGTANYSLPYRFFQKAHPLLQRSGPAVNVKTRI